MYSETAKLVPLVSPCQGHTHNSLRKIAENCLNALQKEMHITQIYIALENYGPTLSLLTLN